VLCRLAFFLFLLRLAQAEVMLLDPGKTTAVIVTPDAPTRVVRYAAEELVRHVEKASGVTWPIVTESTATTGPRIYLGPCRVFGTELEALAPEAARLRVTDEAVFIAGDDGGGDPLEVSTRAGTLWGVYEWLERDLGVRWLWPGDLGTFVPKTRTIIARTTDEIIAPRFLRRHIRPGLGFESAHPALGLTKAAAKQFSDEQKVYLRRHRMGRSQSISYGHAFTDWWEKEGKTHPEWFQQLDSGKRGPSKKNGRFSMCVSNESL
jgi:hypothetical protein